MQLNREDKQHSMKAILLVLMAFSVPLTCAVFAGLLALQGKGGWNWFLTVAFTVSWLISGSIKIKTH